MEEFLAQCKFGTAILNMFKGEEILLDILKELLYKKDVFLSKCYFLSFLCVYTVDNYLLPTCLLLYFTG